MRILITGATGTVGQRLVTALSEHSLILIVRDKTRAEKKLRKLISPSTQFIHSLNELSPDTAIDAVINLAGEPIMDKRWTQQQKQKIANSRIDLTRELSQFILQLNTPPQVFISGSACGYYGNQGSEQVVESTKPKLPSFTHQVCEQWESEALKANAVTRVCLVRTGIILSNNGGALTKLLPIYRYGLGGKLSSGKQYMPWIHIEDMVQGIIFLLNNKTCHGPFNFSAPQSVQNSTFNQQLAKALHRPALIPVPHFMLNLILGERKCLLLDSVNAYPKQLLDQGYQFIYPELKTALNSLVDKS